MTAKLKPIEPKIVSANGSKTSTLERPSKFQLKRATTATVLSQQLPSTTLSFPKINPNQQLSTPKKMEAARNESTKADLVESELAPFEEAKHKSSDENISSDTNNSNQEKNQSTPNENKNSSCTGYSENTCLCSSIDDGSQTVLKRVSYLERRNWITPERLSELRKKAQDAIKNHKIFTIRGCFYSIRKSLVQRGWVEKLDIHRRSVNGSCQVILEELAQHLPQRRPGETRRQHIQKCERNIMSRFLEHMPIDFLWSARKEKSDWIDMARNGNLSINKFHKSPFTTKEGLCNVLRDLHWFVEEGKSELYYPRSYNAWNSDDLAEFIDDYRLTACMSMLRFLVDRCQNSEPECVYSDDGQIPISSIQFALKQCKLYVRSCEHLDIDEDIERIWNHEWELFLMHYNMLSHDHLTFQMPDELRVLCEIYQHWPQSNLDGVFNIWIVKPSNRCRGRGILLMNDIKKIIAHVNPNVINKGRFVIQKYIERPMIIHNCKFDIRQWFLVTSVQPLIIWMYKESYLRFSSQEYDLLNFHESVHLTNFAVQKRYENGKARDERLPRENMWDCHTFQAYLCPQCLEDVIKVVIDHRNDPKASTGNFEMIYKQVIPPAPAYFGLNLCLKGTQVLPKNGTGKKEKPKLDGKPKLERKNSQLYVKPIRELLNGDIERTPILSPRSLMIDFVDYNDPNSLILQNSARKGVHATLTANNKPNLLKNDKVLSSRINSYLSLTRTKQNDLPLSTRKSNIATELKPIRHASCGPKLMSMSLADDVENNEIKELRSIEDDRSKIKCVGNKCGPEIEVYDSAIDSNKSSPRKLQETPRVATSIRVKLKPVNTLPKSARSMVPNSKDKVTTNSNEYRKYLTPSNLQLSKMPQKLPIHTNYYNSHFYAVGMSLRALRSKYNRIKANGINAPPPTANSNKLKRKNVS